MAALLRRVVYETLVKATTVNVVQQAATQRDKLIYVRVFES